MIVTDRLELVPATVESTTAALEGAHALGTALGCAVPPTWPPEYLDTAALEYTLDRLHLNGAGYRAWVDILRPWVAAVPSQRAG